MTTPVPQLLAFPDRKQDGRFPVKDETGKLLAHISVKWMGTSFTAADADDQPLCAASSGAMGLSSLWKATGPAQEPLLSVKKSWTGTSAVVALERGGTFSLRGSPWRRDFAVTDAEGGPLVTAVPQSSGWSFHPHDYAVQQIQPVFDLAEMVAVVQIWRMVKKQEGAAGVVGIGAIGAAGA